MATVRANGRDFHVLFLGRGAPVVMVHGLVFGNLSAWYLTTVAPRLAKGRRVMLYDLRGHGKSEPAAEGFRLLDMAADLAALIEAADGIEPPVDLVGHSYGGLIPLRLALDRSELVRRVVVVDAPVPPFHTRDLDAFVPDAESVIRDMPETGEYISVLPESIRASVIGERRLRRRRDDLSRFRDRTRMSEDLHAEPPLPVEGLGRPVLCVYGRTSPFREKGERLAAAIPGARLVLLEAGHVIPYEAPAELARVIAEFLDG